MINQLQKGKNYFYQISLAMLVAMISIVGCKKTEEAPKPTPVITDFKATSGWVGDVVTITGMNFGADVASNIVKFGDKIAVINSATITELKVVVPAGATTGKVSVNANNATGTSTTDFTVNTETIYIAGYVARNGKAIAGYWKNNTFVSLTDGTKNAYANAIAVVGNDVYVAGTEGDPMTSGKIAKYWKNGVATTLSVQNAEVTGITVVGNDVYVAGTEISLTTKFVARYWKNGVATILSDGITDEGTGNIVIAGNDIYVLSTSFPANGVTKYWKNSNPITVTVNINNGTALFGAFLTSIAVEGSDVYISGNYYDATTGGGGGNSPYTAAYWKNGVRISLEKGNSNALVTSGGTVHSVGRTNEGVTYWKNSVATTLQGSQPSAITVVGSNVYIAGNGIEKNSAGASIYTLRYWKNSVPININSSIGDVATGIVVIP